MPVIYAFILFVSLSSVTAIGYYSTISDNAVALIHSFAPYLIFFVLLMLGSGVMFFKTLVFASSPVHESHDSHGSDGHDGHSGHDAHAAHGDDHTAHH